MTGQYPKRRESDAEAQRRNEVAGLKRQARLDLAVRIPYTLYRTLLPYITASGRLVDPMRRGR